MVSERERELKKFVLLAEINDVKGMSLFVRMLGPITTSGI